MRNRLKGEVMYLVFLVSLFSFSAFALPTIKASYETTPIPAGTESTDDIAIWLHPTTPEDSRIVGVNKNEQSAGGHAGLGLYTIEGKELHYLHYKRLNNVDLKYNFPMGTKKVDLIGASNRDDKSLTFFEIVKDKLKVLANLKFKNKWGEPLTEGPYGFCLSHVKGSDKFYAFTPMKSGLLYQHEVLYQEGKLQLKEVRVLETNDFLDRWQDQELVDLIISDVLYEYDLPKIPLMKKLQDGTDLRFQLEGCVADDELGKIYLGMENFGVWKFNIDPEKELEKELVVQVKKSKAAPDASKFPVGRPRITNDIEGLTLFYGPEGRGALVVSVQGLSEYALFDRQSSKYLGSFKISFDAKDPVTETDGLDLLSFPLGSKFPAGMMVVHDHHNTNKKGQILKANYKIISFDKILKHFPKLHFSGYFYNPRD